MQSLNENARESLHEEAGFGNSQWVSIGVAILLLISMTGLESLLYRMTGAGFLLP